MTRNQKDNFSLQADLYVKYRPHYPPELYTYLFEKAANFNVAWDCGTGNGQVAYQLAQRFEKVFATDISDKQLKNARQADNIDYLLAPAAQTTLATGTVDLITVAQAIHWFDSNLFYNEVQRVARPGATMAYWGYSLPRISEDIDPVIRDFHDNIVGRYWDPERKLLLDKYAQIKFPMIRPEQKEFEYRVQWDLHHLVGYLNSWSSVQRYILMNKKNPVEKISNELKNKVIGNQYITFPVFMTIGYLS